MLQACKPDPVPGKLTNQQDQVVIIYLFRELPPGINLPTLSAILQSRIVSEQLTIEAEFTWHFSMQGLPVFDITIKNRELLPHIFTLIACPPASGETNSRRQLFSVALSVTNMQKINFSHTDTRLFTGALLCAVQTFLPD